MKKAMSKYTQGPWTMDTSRQGDPVVRVPGGRELQNLVDDSTYEANARLMAAAPDLLDALKQLCERVEHYAPEMARNQDLHEAREAIAKAEG